MAKAAELGGRGSRVVALASVCVIAAMLYFGRDVFIPLALAILLSFLLTLPVQWLERLRLPRIVAVLAVVILGLALLVSIGYLVGRQFISVAEQLPSYQGELKEKIQALRSHGGFFTKLQREAQSIAGTTQPTTAPAAGARGEAASAPHSSTAQPSDDNPLPVRVVQHSTSFENLRQYFGTILNPLATAGLVLVFVIFMLYSREDLRDRMIRLIGHGRINLTTQALDEAGTRISRYLGALAIVNALYGAVVASGLWFIGYWLGAGTGFPNVLVWGILVGVFRFVPYVGVWIGAAVPMLLSFALFPGTAAFFATVGMFIVMEIGVSQFIEPYWYGASTGMSALAVLIAAVFWTWLWGPVGLLLSTPLTVCLVVIGKYVPQFQFLDILLGDEPVLPPHVRIYQRLIASDEEEASDLAQEIRDEQSLEKLYDEVLIPALALAVEDHRHGTLDDERLGFVHQSLRELVEELGEREHGRRQREAAARTEKAAKDQPPDSESKHFSSIPRDCVINILLLPARNEADEIVGLMLHQLIELRGYCPISVPSQSLASEMVEMVETRQADLVAVSAMPPAAVAHARYLCKRLHNRFPDIPMVVGLWRAKADMRKAKDRIACGQHVPVIISLAQAQHEIDQLAQPIIVREAQSGKKADSQPKPAHAGG